MSNFIVRLIFIPVFLVLFMVVTKVSAQTRTLNIGDYKFRYDASKDRNMDDDDPTGSWPQDYWRHETVTMYVNMICVGEYIDNTGAIRTKERHWSGISYRPPGYLKEYRRTAPPNVSVFVNGDLLQSSYPFDDIIEPDLPADMMVEIDVKQWPGFNYVKRFYAYSNPNHNDYVIVYNRYKCTFDVDEFPGADYDSTQTIKGVYFGYSFQNQNYEGTYITYSHTVGNAPDDWATWETYPSQLVPGARNLEVTYGWDGDNQDIVLFEPGGPPFDDTGDPRFAIGDGGSTSMPSAEFVSSAYSGWAALHASHSAKDNSDDTEQPRSIISHTEIHNVWNASFPGFLSIYDWAASHTRTTVEAQAGWPGDPSFVKGEMPFQAFGPYDFQYGDSVEIVYVLGANGISRKIAEEKGREWLAWYRGEAGATFDDNAKNALIATSKDSLFQTLDRGLWAWNRGLDIPDPPSSPDLTVRSGPNLCYLEWEDLSNERDPDTGVPDVAGYRVYRKIGAFYCDMPDELRADGVHLRWELIAELPVSSTNYTDTMVVRGESYHYAVTAFDDGSQNTDGLYPGQSLESSYYANRSEIAAIPFSEPDLSKSVLVVPNPYVLQAGDFNFTGEDDRLLFVNLPPFCTLRIFTITGDLIRTIDHKSGSGDEVWDQITESNQLIASGVYVLLVDNGTDYFDNPVAGSVTKFVIIR